MRIDRICSFGLAAVLAASAVASADPDKRKLKDIGPLVHGPMLVGAAAGLSESVFESLGMTLLSQIPLNNFPGAGADGADCWGYVSPSGREYAIFGTQCSIQFIEVTNPTNPVIVGSITAPCALWKDVKVMGEFAYAVSDSAGLGIQVIDLRQIDAGTVTLTQNKMQGGHRTTHNIVANDDSGYLYLVGANVANGGLVALDVSNPADPIFAGSWSTMYVHDANIVSYTTGPLAGREIAFCFGGFNGGWVNTGLRIVDVTDKANMVLLGETTWPNAEYSHQGWLSTDRQFVYVNDELDEQRQGVSTTTRIVDVSDLANPSVVGSFTTGLPSIDHNLYVKGDLIFESNYRSGLRVFDATDPLNPTEIAFFDTYPNSNSANFGGAWSTYPYFPSGTILISDTDRGLFVVRLDCYADCDQSTGVGVLDIFDFLCFQDAFVTGDPYACDCDTSTGPGVCDVLDFLCFQDAFVAECP